MAAKKEIRLEPFYVYALVDPTAGNEIFYIGKGKSTRGHDHLREAQRAGPGSNEKLLRINRIRSQGMNPKVAVLGRFASEAEAFAVESSLIHWVYGIENLTNVQSGHNWRNIRPRASGFIELEGIDIPKKLKVSGTGRSGYLKEIISAHERLGHLEMAKDLLDYLRLQKLPGLCSDVEAIEGGRYVALSVAANDQALIFVQVTAASNHRVVLNLKPRSNRKADRHSFLRFTSTLPDLEAKNGGAYAKFLHWKSLVLKVTDHTEIHDYLVDAIRRLT